MLNSAFVSYRNPRLPDTVCMLRAWNSCFTDQWLKTYWCLMKSCTEITALHQALKSKSIYKYLKVLLYYHLMSPVKTGYVWSNTTTVHTSTKNRCFITCSIVGRYYPSQVHNNNGKGRVWKTTRDRHVWQHICWLLRERERWAKVTIVNEHRRYHISSQEPFHLGRRGHKYVEQLLPRLKRGGNLWLWVRCRLEPVQRQQSHTLHSIPVLIDNQKLTNSWPCSQTTIIDGLTVLTAGRQYHLQECTVYVNHLTPTVVIWVQLQGWASECPDVKNYKWPASPGLAQDALYM